MHHFKKKASIESSSPSLKCLDMELLLIDAKMRLGFLAVRQVNFTLVL